jgi:phage protein U
MSAITEIMYALGDYRFGVGTAAAQESDRTTTYRWADLPIIGQAPVSQFIGEDLDSFTIRGVIYPFFQGGFGQIKKMRIEAGKGIQLRLVVGTGEDLGLWTIRKISQRDRKFVVKGAPAKIEFELELKRYAG